MNKQLRLQKIVASLTLGIGLIFGVNASAISHPRYSDSSSNYHRRSFRNIQPFRSLNVTPRSYIPLPPSRYRHDSYGRRYSNDNNHRQRRVFRRGVRQPINSRRSRDYHRDSNHYIRIRIR